MIRKADVPSIDAIKMITVTPARILNVSDKKGSLAAGKDADIVIFDNNINIEATVVQGRIVYKKYADKD
jgi:N-acetylglucosamine-6-phosphate deacetylase